MSIKIDKSLILNKIKEHYFFKKDADFARFLDIRPQTLSSWYSRNSFDIDLLYSKCVDLDANWLITGKGNMLKETKSEKIEEETRLIPLYGGVVTASLVGNTMDPTSQPIEMINAGDWFKDGDCAMRVYGDSMSPNYTSGSIVVMKEVKNKALILPGEDYMVETSEYRVLKRLQKSEVKGCILACSTNEEVWESGSMKGRSIYEPFDIFIDDITRLYLILGTVRRNHN